MAARPCTGDRVGTTPTSRPSSRARAAARAATADSPASFGRTTTSTAGDRDHLVEDLVLGDAVGTACDDPNALAAEEVGEPLAADDGDDGARAGHRRRRGDRGER